MKIRMLALSDSVLSPTGFANQTRNLLTRLSKDSDFEIIHLAWNYNAQPLKKATLIDGEELNFSIVPGGREQHGKDTLQAYIRQLRPDITWVLLDTFMLYPWAIDIDFSPSKNIFYFPSDGEYFPLRCENVLRKFSHRVAMSKFAQEQVKRDFQIESDYIPHGVDTKIFYPYDTAAKKKWRAHWKIRDDQFLIGCVARNQGRKNMQALIRAFAIFSKGKDDVVLLLHMDMYDPAATTDLWELVRRLKIENKVLSTGINWFSGFPSSDMPHLYNIMDVFVLPTTGEGFGIPTLEAMSCGIPVVLTDYTTTKEMVIDNNAGLACKPIIEITGNWNVDRAFIHEKDMAALLQKFYDHPNLKKLYGDKGRQAAVEQYDWDTMVYPAWSNYLKNKVMGDRK